jgi:integrase
MPQVSLTDRFAAGAKSPEIQTDYFDDNPKTRGLCLRVSSVGRKTWCLLFTSPKDRKRARMTLGGYPATSLARARTLAIEAHSHLDEGRDPRDVAAQHAAGAMTVAGMIESFLEKHARPNLRSAGEIERRLMRNVAPIIGSMKACDLHRRDMNRVVDPVLARGRRVEASRVFEDFRAVVRWAVARGDLDHNPFDGMKKPNGSAPRERTLSDDEIRAVWNGLPTVLARSQACQRIIKLCLVTAQRLGEVAGMEAGELDLKAATWIIPGRRTKNARTNIVPLSTMAVDIIGEAMTDAGKDAKWLFPKKDRKSPLPIEVVDKTVKRANQPSEEAPLGRFGTPHWTPHDLRRTALTNFAALGIPPIVAGAVANHISVTKATITLAVYTQYTYEKEKREALNLWSDRLRKIVCPLNVSGLAPDRDPHNGHQEKNQV